MDKIIVKKLPIKLFRQNIQLVSQIQLIRAEERRLNMFFGLDIRNNICKKLYVKVLILADIPKCLDTYFTKY